MNSRKQQSLAFGAPGIEPRWTSSEKEGVGTAYHTSCRLWFTISHGIINEIYYPRVDQPNRRDFRFLISDGESFCHEEKRDLQPVVEYPDRDCLLYRLTNSEANGRYKLIKHVLAEEATVVWSTDAWARVNRADTAIESGLNLWFLDFSTSDWPSGSVFSFTLCWKRDQRWQERNWDVSIL